MVKRCAPADFPPPPKDVNKLEDWCREYLAPDGKGAVHRAHKFICNVLTYPLVRDLHFAAVPNAPPVSKKTGRVDARSMVRPASLLAGLFATRPGDLIFFHQSERFGAEESLSKYFGYEKLSQARRGVVGLFRILGEPFSDSTDITHPGTGYKIAGSCPVCGTRFSWMKASEIGSPNRRVRSYWCPGSVLIPNQRDHQNPNNFPGSLTLSNRLDLEPLIVFPQPIGDNRVYTDFSDHTLLWTGRFDIRMGAGKGSTTRQLLPEEAVKLVRLLIDEAKRASENFEKPEKRDYPSPPQRIEEVKDYMGVPHRFLSIDNHGRVKPEMLLNLYFSLNANKKSSLSETLSDVYELPMLEYFSSEFPLGVAKDESDFLILFKEGKTGPRFRALHFEFKRYELENRTLAELMLYVPWIAQVCTQFAEPAVEKFEIVPILVGNRKAMNLKSTKEYTYKEKYLVGPEKEIVVRSSRVLLYEPVDVFQESGNSYAKNLSFRDVTHKCKKVNWDPNLKGLSKSDLEWVLQERWSPTGVQSTLYS